MFNQILDDHLSIVEKLRPMQSQIDAAAAAITKTLSTGGKILICGNGGSAADAQDFAAELVGRFLKNRRALPSIALTTDTSIITSVGNDYSFDEIFSRQVEALAQKGDLLVGLSTSGNSPNVQRAIVQAREIGCATLSLLGKDGGSIKGISDQAIVVPCDVTARVQECHILLIHYICTIVEKELFS